MVALKHFILVKTHSIAILSWEICSFERVQERVCEAPLVVGLDVDYCFYL